ncbi:MAG: O-antigen ligase family protein [Bryobacteraceae bacterium]
MWPSIILCLLLGYMCSPRSFAYIGVPPVNLFIGELTLGAFLVLKPNGGIGRWMTGLLKGGPLESISWIYLGFGLFGVLEAMRGFLAGHAPVSILQNLVFNYYPLYLFIGMWAGTRRPDLLPTFIRILAWVNGIYGVAYILYFSRLPYTMPGTGDVPLFEQPGGSAAAILGLLCFERRLGRFWLPLLLNAFVLLGLQVRAELLGLSFGLAIWAVVNRQISRVALCVVLVATLLVLGSIADVQVPGPRGDISTRHIVGRFLAPIDAELAAEYNPQALSHEGTFLWRTEWWKEIWASTHSSFAGALWGHGYGYPLSDLVPYIRDEVIRTPHNVFFYALGYTGWIGVMLFYMFQLALASLLWRRYRADGCIFGLLMWAVYLVQSHFGNFFETPFGAIPFYLLTGLSAVPAAWPRPSLPVEGELAETFLDTTPLVQVIRSI